WISEKYQHKNMLILYDTVGALAYVVGQELSNPTYVEILMPPLTNRWSKLKDNSVDLIPLLDRGTHVLAQSLSAALASSTTHCYRGLARHHPGVHFGTGPMSKLSLFVLLSTFKPTLFSYPFNLVPSHLPTSLQLTLSCQHRLHPSLSSSSLIVFLIHHRCPHPPLLSSLPSSLTTIILDVFNAKNIVTHQEDQGETVEIRLARCDLHSEEAGREKDSVEGWKIKMCSEKSPGMESSL
ncbi:hypothetical protein VNI00_017364, partial [Paramarasmius palmivorus]